MTSPPVNGLGYKLRGGLMDSLKKAAGDPTVKAAIIIGSAKCFSGGADIREFNPDELQSLGGHLVAFTLDLVDDLIEFVRPACIPTPGFKKPLPRLTTAKPDDEISLGQSQ